MIHKTGFPSNIDMPAMTSIHRHPGIALRETVEGSRATRRIAWLTMAIFVVAGFGRASAAALKIPGEHPRIFFTKTEALKFKAQLQGSYAPQAGEVARSIIRQNGF